MSRHPDPVEDEPRHCPVCGALLSRRAGEHISNFRSRQSCGAPRCVSTLRRASASDQAERQRHARNLQEWPAWADFGPHERPPGRRAPLGRLPAETLVKRERWF